MHATGALQLAPSRSTVTLAPVEQLHLFGAPRPVCLQWCTSSAPLGAWLSFAGDEKESLVDRLVDDVDQFACDANQAVSLGRPEAIAELKKATIERALAYYDQLGDLRTVDITAALTVLVDFVRGIEMLTHAVLAGSNSQYIVRLSTATGGPRYRNDPPRTSFAKSRRSTRSTGRSDDDAAEPDHIPLAKQSTPYCDYTPARMMFPHVSPSHAAEAASSAQIANIWRTTAISVENLLERSIGELRARLDEAGYGLESLHDIFAQ